MFFKKFTLIFYGPTAVGKTDLALTLAKHIPCEIINGDLGQFYTPLSIGTAKPDWRSLSVPHHLFDILDEPKNFTVTQYRQQVITLVQEIWQRNKVPIIVGGSGFYIKSLFFPPRGQLPENTVEFSIPDEQLWQELHRIDPVRANAIHPSDMYRIKRALNIWATTGQSPSLYTPTFEPPTEFYMCALTRERSDLYARINERVSLMIEQGWLEEVSLLRHTEWEDFLREKKIIGYELILDYLAAGAAPQELPALIDAIAQRTRNYAKRQETYGRMLMASLTKAIVASDSLTVSAVRSANLTLLSLDLYIKQLLLELSNRYQ